ncbi:alkaline phosphatase D family protein [Deinococcus budaensis]|uniref:Phosphodiesterase/alkaline phosphatase D-like protein n=1 Tax=Deinococcus budaensis TaxID=1665626 RepID=A0A7W8LQ59_9DEIO|nr:alkaline phosphatase D family protein [Deinococcus budaensis]MBB5234498.1 phosphodiesterase/alkaline phosphatase D-like protein [Deinococcus budaensis]
MNVVQQKHTNLISTTAYTSHAVTLAAPATAGNLLFALISVDKGPTAIATPSGWTLLEAYTTASTSAALCYRVAAGGETGLIVTWDVGRLSSSLFLLEASGLTATPTFTSLNSGENNVNAIDFPPMNLPGAGTALVAYVNDSHGAVIPTSTGGITRLSSTGSAEGDRTASIPECFVGYHDAAAAETFDAAVGFPSAATDQSYGAIVFFPASAGTPAATLRWAWSGVGTQTGGTVVAKTSAAASVRLRYSTAADLSGAQDTPAVTTAAPDLTARFTPGGLTPGTVYHYGVVIDGVLQAARGKFKTAPAAPASFTLVASSCAATGSTSTVFARIAARNPDVMLQMGDLHYSDISGNDPPQYRAAYDNSVGVSQQQALYRQVGTSYVWSDHDFGPNNSDSTSPGKPAAMAVYRTHVPSLPLPAEGVYHTFTWGRVQVIATDQRYFATPATATDNASKTKLGATQKQWFKDTCLAAKAAGRAIVWVNPEPWIGAAGTGEDHWGMYATERAELATFFQQNGLNDRLVIVSGDMHGLALDDGTNSNYAAAPAGKGPPVYQAGSLDQSGSVKGGPYTGGSLAGPGQYGLLIVTDTGGATLTVQFQGIKPDETVWNSHTATLSVPPVQAPYMTVENGQQRLVPFPALGGTPSPHAASHAEGGTDPITPASIGAATTGHVHNAATTTVPGFLSAADKSKLDGLSSYTDEQAQDAAASLLTTGTHSGITFAYDDVAGKLNASVSVSGGVTTKAITANTAANTTVTPATITGLDFPLLASTTYGFEFMILFQSAAPATGIALNLLTTNTAQLAANADIPAAADGTAGTFHGWITASADKVIGTGVQAATTTYVALIYGVVRTTASAGTIVPQFSSEVAGSGITVMAESHGRLWAVR